MSTSRALALTLCVSLLPPAASLAQTAPDAAPMSAIDWLGQPVPQSELAVMTEDPVTEGVETEAITVTALDTARLDGLGVFPGAMTGLPADLWGTSPAERIAALIRQQPVHTLPALQDMLQTVLLAELDPPGPATADGIVFLARLDRLLAMGALDQAAALLDQVATKPAPLVQRAFDVALLTGEEDRACAALRAAPGVAPDPGVQVFCQARAGDLSGAEITLRSAAALGALPEADAAMLARFLDPGGDEDAAPVVLADPVTPLAFRVAEAIGEPVPTSALPLAFARSDLRALSGWKAQIDAAERLARARAIPAGLLFSIYAQGRPAASGGVWERVRAIQLLDDALRRRAPADVAAAIGPASRLMQQAGLDVALAEYIAPLLEDLPLPGAAGALAFRLELLGGDAELAARARQGAGRQEQILIGIATGTARSAPADTPLEAAVRRAFSAITPPPELAQLVSDGRLGEAILRAALLLSAGIESDPGDVTAALQLFRAIGLEQVARAAALQLVLIARPV